MQALRQAPDYEEVIIALLGDIVEGENIYPAQEHFLTSSLSGCPVHL
jgi:hypothetical protein